MAEVSIIVPVYQVEKYIRQCVDSILAQTFRDFELILVDDGSRDMSGEICDEYANADTRVKVIHTENVRAAEARNKGINLASGNYLMFIDSDDYISSEMVEILYRNIQKENVDIVACNYRYIFGDDENKDFSTNFVAETLSGKDVFYHRKNERNYGYWTVVWNKLYKKEVFKKLRFRTGKYYEDEFFANDMYRMNINIATITDCLYFYRQHDCSTMKTKSIAKSFDVIEAFQERIYVYLKNEQYSKQAYKVLVYSLEHLAEAKKLISNEDEKGRFIQAEKRTRTIAKQIQKSRVPLLQRVSLIFIGLNPCHTFNMGMRFRGLLERFI